VRTGYPISGFIAVGLLACVNTGDPGARAQARLERCYSTVSDGKRCPKVIRSVPPRYPAAAARDGIEGWVRLEGSIGPQGEVFDVRVVESHSPGVFDRAAVRSFQKWKYCAKLRRPISAKTIILFNLPPGRR